MKRYFSALVILAISTLPSLAKSANIDTTAAAISATGAKLYGQTDAGTAGWVDGDSLVSRSTINQSTTEIGLVRDGTTSANNAITGAALSIARLANTASLFFRGKSSAGISGSTFIDQIFSYSTNANGLEIYTTGAKPLVFGTNSTERMRIAGDGSFQLSADFGFGTGSHYGKFFINDTRTTIDRHGFEDWATLATTDTGLGYSSFDAKTTMTNPNNQDHLVAYQARNIYNGSANITSRFVGFHSFPTTTGAGNIVNAYGVKVDDITGTGTVTNNYGVYVGNTVKGSAKNYAIYTDGGTIHHAGIPVYANNAAAIAGGLVAGDLYRTGADPDPLMIVH